MGWGVHKAAIIGSWQKAQAPGLLGAAGQRREMGRGEGGGAGEWRMGLPFSHSIKLEKPSFSIKEWI